MPDHKIAHQPLFNGNKWYVFSRKSIWGIDSHLRFTSCESLSFQSSTNLFNQSVNQVYLQHGSSLCSPSWKHKNIINNCENQLQTLHLLEWDSSKLQVYPWAWWLLVPQSAWSAGSDWQKGGLFVRSLIDCITCARMSWGGSHPDDDG